MISILVGTNGDLTVDDLNTLVALVAHEVNADPLAKHLPDTQDAIGRIETILDTALMEAEK